MATVSDPNALMAAFMEYGAKNDLMKDMMPYFGQVFDGIVIDEWSGLDTFPIRRPAVAVYENAAFPEAKVFVYENWTESRDPKNPNPSAGRQRIYKIVTNGRQVPTDFYSLAMAQHQAEGLHERLVAGLLEDKRKSQPNFGRF
jgi:hypothetical protein